jgi:hypothetical protein
MLITSSIYKHKKLKCYYTSIKIINKNGIINILHDINNEYILAKFSLDYIYQLNSKILQSFHHP